MARPLRKQPAKVGFHSGRQCRKGAHSASTATSRAGNVPRVRLSFIGLSSARIHCICSSFSCSAGALLASFWRDRSLFVWEETSAVHIWCSAARPPLPPPPHGIPPPPCGSLWCGFPPAPPHCGCRRLPPPVVPLPLPSCGRLRPLPWLLLVGRLASGC